jgi:hypothetical protein
MTEGTSRAVWLPLAATLAGCVQVALGPERSLEEGGSAGAATCDQGGDGCCDPGSDVLWLRTFGDASYDHIASMAPDGEGGVYVSGWFAGAIDLGGGPMLSHGDRDAFIARFDGGGALLWAKVYGTPASDEIGPSLIRHPQGVALCGTSFTNLDLGDGPHPSDAAGDGYVALISRDGDLVWERWIDGPGEQRCWGKSAVDPATGDVLATVLFADRARVGAETIVGQGQVDILVLRVAAGSGVVSSSVAFGTPATEQPQGLAVLADGSVAIAGFTEGDLDLGIGPQPHDGPDAFVALLSRDLSSTLWGHVYTAPGEQKAQAIQISAAGDILVSGTTKGPVDLGAGPITEFDGGFVARLATENGLATESAPLGGFNQPLMLQEAAGGEIVLAGNYYGSMTLGGATQAHPGTDGLSADPVAVKLSPDFRQAGWKQLAATSARWESITGVALGEDDTVFLSGPFWESLTIDGCKPRVSAGDADTYLLKRKL